MLDGEQADQQSAGRQRQNQHQGPVTVIRREEKHRAEREVRPERRRELEQGTPIERITVAHAVAREALGLGLAQGAIHHRRAHRPYLRRAIRHSSSPGWQTRHTSGRTG